MTKKSSQHGSSGTPTKTPSGSGGDGGINDNQDDVLDEVEDEETDDIEASGDDDEGDEKPVVKRSTYLKTLNEAKTAKAKLREYEENQRKANERKLAENNEFKALWESQKSRAEELEAKHTDLLGQISNARKINAFQSTLKGVVKPEYQSFINTESILIDPETGEIDEVSVAREVSRFQKAYPELVHVPGGHKTKSPAPKGDPGPNKITRSEWLKLSDKDMWKWKDDQIIDD